jgi:UPF0716 protein FxsA
MGQSLEADSLKAMPLLALLAIFIVVPLAELYVILKVGDAIGVFPTLAILVADSLLGTYLLRSQGRAVWRRFQEAMAAGRMPHREVLDGIAVIFGGAFLITPGFLTDIVGVLLLLPPTRSLIIRFFGRTALRGMAARFVVRGPVPGRRPDADVEGTATEYPPTDPPRIER